MTRLIRAVRAVAIVPTIRALSVVAVIAGTSALAGCTPHVGDKCVLSTDCSVQGTLVCDTSQPDGYCTELNCIHQSCPANSLCVQFQSSVPGCAYDDYQAPSRTGRSFCMENCSKDSDCRESDGYVCADPRDAPWNGAILDDNQSQGVCIVKPSLVDAGSGAQFDAAICQPYEAPDSGPDAGDGGMDGAVDAGPDASPESGLEPDAGTGADATTDATTAADSTDASTDAPGGG